MFVVFVKHIYTASIILTSDLMARLVDTLSLLHFNKCTVGSRQCVSYIVTAVLLIQFWFHGYHSSMLHY